MNWNKKSIGVNKRKPAELRQALDEGTKRTLLCLISNIYKTGKIPDDFKKSVILKLPKERKSTNCEEYRTLSILTHTSKIFTKIILGWLEKKIVENRAEDQFGFRKNRGKWEAILYLRNIVEKSFTVKKKVYIFSS
jgi:hypothetical protein